MPSGRTHDRITLWLLPWIVGLSMLLSRSAAITLLVSGGFLFSGLMFGPDLDIHSVQYLRWGFVRWIWRPYQLMIPHRSWLSHGWLVGTVVRLLYLGTLLTSIATPLMILIQILGGIDWDWPQLPDRIFQFATQQYPQEVIAVILGLELGSMSHSFSDWTGSTYKRLKRRTRPRKRKKRR